jgi:hypothetical protein
MRMVPATLPRGAAWWVRYGVFVIASVQCEKWWERRQKRSGQLFYGCDDVAGVTYVCPRGCDIIADYPPTLTSPEQHSNPLQYRSHQHRLRCHRRRLPNRPTYTTHTQSIRGGPEYHPRQNNTVLAEESTLRVVSRRQHKREHKREQNGSKMGAAAAQEGAKWEQNGSGGSSRGSKRGSKMGAAAAQEGAKEGAKWERRQPKREQNGSKMGAAAAQEGAKEGAAAGAAWGAEASALLGFWVWGRCFFRFSTAAGLSVVVRCIGIWFCCTISIWHSCVLVPCWL